jgi:hypothetical protein
VLRGLIALATMWCLGCSAFDPLLDHLAGVSAASGMVCESDGYGGPVTERVGGAAHAELPAVHVVPTTDAGSDGGYVCGCQSCHAASLAAYALSIEPLPAPSVPATEPIALLSVVREPLVPPPQPVL